MNGHQIVCLELPLSYMSIFYLSNRRWIKKDPWWYQKKHFHHDKFHVYRQVLCIWTMSLGVTLHNVYFTPPTVAAIKVPTSHWLKWKELKLNSLDRREKRQRSPFAVMISRAANVHNTRFVDLGCHTLVFSSFIFTFPQNLPLVFKSIQGFPQLSNFMPVCFNPKFQLARGSLDL